MRREDRARAFIAPPLGGWEGLNLQESVTVDASGGNWHSRQGAGLEQTGAEGGPIVREVERVCGRL